MHSQDVSRTSSPSTHAASPRGRSSSIGSSNLSDDSFGEDVKKETGLWSATTGSPTVSSPIIAHTEYDVQAALRDIDEHELLLNPPRIGDGEARTASPLSSKSEPEESAKPKEAPVTWMSLPRKGQLFLLMMARISEPLTQTSLQAYMYYQLKSFNPSLPDSTVAAQVGLMQGSFTAAQFLTAFMWGKVAASSKIGRKRVLLVGLLGTAVSILGFGFSRSFATAMLFRSLGGILNGNVGVMRTMIAEIIKEKKHAIPQS